jgi:uncharacterized protein (DUF433 family)
MDLSLLQRVTIEPGKCGGRPCIRGKRIRVTDILELLANGASVEEIVEDYPTLERDVADRQPASRGARSAAG